MREQRFPFDGKFRGGTLQPVFFEKREHFVCVEMNFRRACTGRHLNILVSEITEIELAEAADCKAGKL
jgi:hypothetical protein